MRRRVLLVQPSLQPPGGGNGVAAWMLQALADEHDLTVLSWWPIEVASIDSFFGTSLRRCRFKSLLVPSTWRAAVDRLPIPASLLRSSLLMRAARRRARDFDVLIGAHNESDYGRRGIQYVHYPTYLRPRPQVDLRWYHVRPLLGTYYSIADRLAGFSVERMTRNLTLANSNWTAAQITKSLGIRAETLYPPVVEHGASIAWESRRRGFLVIGRISPEKEYERVIRILAAVRHQIPDLTLTIVGTFDAASRPYFEQIQRVIRALDAAQWVSFRQHIPRAEVNDLMATHRYGIHGMREEHFGMAPAEMVRSRMVVWVPDGGGQVEIVGNQPLLRYTSEEDAARKIVQVISSPLLEQQLRDHLAAHSERFSVERFITRMREIVATFNE